jgi:hypothetical protein
MRHPSVQTQVFQGICVHLSGSITALATPFTASGALDLDAWGRLLRSQIAAGTQAVVVAGSTGEANASTPRSCAMLLRRRPNASLYWPVPASRTPPRPLN